MPAALSESGPAPSSAEPPGRFGLAISCTPSCTRARAADGSEYWKYDAFPTIAALRPAGPAERLGLQVGDLVTKIDGFSILEEKGALRLFASERARSLHVTVLRDGKETGYLLQVR